jgi:hypothetical protein
MTGDIPEPVTAETEDLRAFFGKRAGTLQGRRPTPCRGRA